MDELTVDALFEVARRDPYGSLGLHPRPELAFIGVRALRELADFCEGYQGAAYARRGTAGRVSLPGPA